MEIILFLYNFIDWDVNMYFTKHRNGQEQRQKSSQKNKFT